jgi:hypothetical protein
VREIEVPNPVDSVLFLNKQGHILVSHSKRVSLLTAYLPDSLDNIFKGEQVRVDMLNLHTKVSDQLLLGMKNRDQQNRQETPKVARHLSHNNSQVSGIIEDDSPLTKKALAFFSQLEELKTSKPTVVSNQATVLPKEQERRVKMSQIVSPNLLAKKKQSPKHKRSSLPDLTASEAQMMSIRREKHKKLKPFGVTALPRLPYPRSLASSPTNSLRKHPITTRRDATEDRIS